MIMEIIERVLSIAFDIYKLVGKVKANKECCQRILGRVQPLEELVRSIDKRMTIQSSDQVEKALVQISNTLISAKLYIEKYADSSWAERLVKVSNHGDDFKILTERLNDTFQLLSGALMLEQGNAHVLLYEKVSKWQDDENAKRKDEAELKDLLLKHITEQQEKLDNLKHDVEKLIQMMSKPHTTEVNRMIESRELQYEPDKKPIMETSTSEVYKGKYCGFPVAIKRYKDPVRRTTKEMSSFFKREVETLKHFDSPNILRMYGICILNKNGANPQYLIVTEYCEMGSLRQVLDSNDDLSWTTKINMCLDAAQGLYRLHQTGVKSKIHGCLTSNKFLVAEGYKVKLGGFELAKTETSLQRSKNEDDTRESCYQSPQKLNDVNYNYTKECEMYSFGLIMWEIATRDKPFDGWSIKQIEEKVCKENSNQPLPEDCPSLLKEVIDSCRNYDSFHRPSAGEVVDKLKNYVAQLEKQ